MFVISEQNDYVSGREIYKIALNTTFCLAATLQELGICNISARVLD